MSWACSGPAFAVKALGLQPSDFWVLVLPLGIGLVARHRAAHRVRSSFVARKRLIEIGLVSLGVSLLILGAAQGLGLPSDGLLSLRNVSVLVAFTAGISYAFVAVPAQTALQEELPEDVRGRVFGVLNTLVSLASFLPIIIVGPVADVIGPTAVIILCAGVVGADRRRLVLLLARHGRHRRSRRDLPAGRPDDGRDPVLVADPAGQAALCGHASVLPSPIDYMAPRRSCPGKAGPAEPTTACDAGRRAGQGE